MLWKTLLSHLFTVTLIVPFSFYNVAKCQRVSTTSLGTSPCDQWDACSQICEETNNGRNVMCSCLENFHLEADNRSCLPNDSTITLVVALTASVQITTFHQSNPMVVTLTVPKGQAVGVTVDIAGEYVYWTDAAHGKEAVHRAKANGEGDVETIVNTGLLLPEGIAFDWVTSNIYFVDSIRGQIIACRGDGKYCAVVARQMTNDKPRDVALHPIQGLMFWTDWGDGASIMRAWMDGTAAVPLIIEGLKWPNSLSVDLGRNRLYWVDAFNDKVETSTLTGTDRQVVNVDKIHHPFSLEVFGDMIYWSDWQLRQIVACTKFACKSDIRAVFNTTILPHGVAILHPASQPRLRSNSCQSKCSHLCVLSGPTGYSCKCPAGYKLDRTRKTCIDDDSTPKILIGHDNYLKVLRFGSIGRDVEVVEELKISYLTNIGAIAYNSINDSVFISDLTYKSISEYFFGTQQLRTLTNRHVDSVKSLSFDPVGENLYWVDSSQRKVEVMSCRTGAKAIITMEADHPQSIVVVPEERYLFLSVTGQRGGRILRMNMNGYRRRTFYRTDSGEPISLTYNAATRQIFWIDSGKDSIEHISLNGNSQAMTVQKGTPYGMTSFQTQIFWIDRRTQLMHSMTVFGAEIKESPVFFSRVDDKYTNGTAESNVKGNFLASLTIAHKDMTVYENLTKYHECSPSRGSPKCSHICLLSDELNVGTCICPDGMQLTVDNRTCAWTTSCTSSQFQCHDTKCIDKRWVCDSVPDCENGEDEQNCGTVSACAGETNFMCESDRSCIRSSLKCDGQRDCPNGEDEYNCGKHSCSPDKEFQCNNGRCIAIAWRCDRQSDCPEGDDEIGCGRTCSNGTFQCNPKLSVLEEPECIPAHWVCDDDPDCKDGSDELHSACVLTSTSTEGAPIIDTEKRNDTSHGNRDETSTTRLFESCPTDKFTCFTGECLSHSKVCDTTIDCPDGSDEGPGCEKSCLDNNECPHECLSTPSGSKCECHLGFEQDPYNKRGCVDVDECAAAVPCDHICINTRGSFKCACHDGYALRNDQRRCKTKSKTTESPRVNLTHVDEPLLCRGSLTGWWVFGIFLMLLMIGHVVGYVFYKKRLYRKMLRDEMLLTFREVQLSQ